ncbi:hypothetical protein DICA4_E13344 [Diutina catenulata]
MSLLFETTAGNLVIDLAVEKTPRVCYDLIRLARRMTLAPVRYRGKCYLIGPEIPTPHWDPKKGHVYMVGDTFVIQKIDPEREPMNPDAGIGTNPEENNTLANIEASPVPVVVVSVVVLHNPFSVRDEVTFDYKISAKSRANALALEALGDLPDFRIQPSPSVVFVARLGEETTAQSLEIVFGRFGPVSQCVIKENDKGGRFAFVEFDEAMDADAAVSQFTNHKCIIDGKNVHVDYSQSVKR